MPMEHIAQPELLKIDETTRLRRFDDQYNFALDWYQDVDTVRLVDGVDQPYTMEKLTAMYHYLDRHGELYFIEVQENGVWLPVGDVCMWQEDLPIVISRPYWKRGLGRKTIRRLIQRAKELGWSQCLVDMIYHYNRGSRRLFESCGFVAYEETEKGCRYRLTL